MIKIQVRRFSWFSSIFRDQLDNKHCHLRNVFSIQEMGTAMSSFFGRSFRSQVLLFTLLSIIEINNNNNILNLWLE